MGLPPLVMVAAGEGGRATRGGDEREGESSANEEVLPQPDQRAASPDRGLQVRSWGGRRQGNYNTTSFIRRECNFYFDMHTHTQAGQGARTRLRASQTGDAPL